MAGSPAHRWGQIIGEVLEAAILPALQDFARQHDLYLDRQEDRPCRKGRKCTWVDSNGNAHDLDFVLERGGSPEKIGNPVAFIETAWRRYTKHSRNKAQEIQGALVPLATRFNRFAPFKGVILAGVFTEGALTQLRSLGFTILYFPYEMILQAFDRSGIDASSEEDTPDRAFQSKVNKYERLSVRKRASLAADLMKINDLQVRQFMQVLATSISRRIDRVIVLPLHGIGEELATLKQAIDFIEGYAGQNGNKPLQRFEIQLHYSNGDRIEGRFSDKQGAIEFLQTYKTS
jgi:hypothetical protein